VESSCECCNEPSGSIKCWELPRGCTTCGLSSGTQLHRVSQSVTKFPIVLPISPDIGDASSAGTPKLINFSKNHRTNRHGFLRREL
jgi:hypothetical protein